MAGGVTTVEIKSGYGLDIETELKMLRAARALGESEKVRVERTLLALHALPAEFAERREEFVRMAVDSILPAAADQGLASAVDAFCEGIGFTPDEVRELFEAASDHGLAVKLHAEQLSNLRGAELAADYGALSADHLEHADEAGGRGDGAGRDGRGAAARRLLCAQGDEEAAGRAAAPLRRADGGGDRLQSRHLAGAVADPDDVDGLHPVRPDPGGGAGRNDPRTARRRWACRTSIGTISAGKAADLCIWRIGRPAELCYWIGMGGPERRIVAGEDA